MTKTLDLKRTVFELTEEFPEVIDIMANLGFSEIANKAIRQSMGRVTTIPMGAKMKHIPLADIVRAFTEQGFEVLNAGEAEPATDAAKPAAPAATAPSDSRTETLKSYLKRLGAGESLESVRADFVREFGEVEASEIMRAEQELLKEGTPLAEVQKLCDVHSALFHGATREEKIANAERAVQEALKRQAAFPQGDYSNKAERAAALEAIPGHPLRALTRENDALAVLLAEMKASLDRKEDVSVLFERIREISVHYSKKGDLLFPLLKVKYGITGPSDVMWTVDDEIRDELSALARETERGEWWRTRLADALKRADEMIYKEQNILFPICAVNFTEEEWRGIYRDAKDYAPCFDVEPEVWEAAEGAEKPAPALSDGEVVMPGGRLTPAQIAALFNTIPMEITFVDADDINRFFNEGPKVFKRPGMALGRDVHSCHPPKIEAMARAVIEDFRSGKRDSVPIWMEKGGRTMLVTYMAVRNDAGEYLGTVELVQDMEFAKRRFAGKA